MCCPSTVSGAKPRLQISWAGSGIYFWWQLGAVHYLLQQFELDKVSMTGASGGGFAAVLAACNVDPLEVMDSAYKLSLEHNIWERPLGLMGVWGGIIEEWLHDLLPADAAEQCRDKVGLVVTQLPSCKQVRRRQEGTGSEGVKQGTKLHAELEGSCCCRVVEDRLYLRANSGYSASAVLIWVNCAVV
jgi:hypothetical protein